MHRSGLQLVSRLRGSMCCVLLASSLLAAGAIPVWSQSAETSKLFTEDAPPVVPGSTEVQITYIHGVRRQALDQGGGWTAGTRAEMRHLALSVTHGLRDGLDLSGSLRWTELLRDDSGEIAQTLGSLQLNLKWQIYEAESGKVSISWLPGFYSPVTDPERTAPAQDFWSLDNLFAVTWVAGRFNLSGDAGFALAIGSERAGQVWAGVADLGCGFQVTPWFQPVVELNAIYTEVTGQYDGRSLGATVGAVFNIPRNIRLDVGAQEFLRGRNTDDGSIFLANLSVTF